MNRRPGKRGFILRPAIAVALSALLFALSCGKKPRETAVEPPPTVPAPLIDPWRVAANKVEEARDEPTGRRAKVNVPERLKHYSEIRRFLAVQIAESRKHEFILPHDFVELIGLIRSGQMVEIEPVGKDYILYGVGGNATDEMFSHYDRMAGENIPLFAEFKEFEEEDARLEVSIKEIKSRLAGLQIELRKTKRRDRQRRSSLLAQVSESRKALSETESRRSTIASYYRNAERRKLIERELATLQELASDFKGESYDLADPASRRKMKVRLLSFLRPEAQNVLLELSRSYNEKFSRPLPVTSLVRPEQYQRLLGETNPNATRNEAPPHSTGLAFDVYYYYMTGAEQDYLMAEVARMEEEGRVEALRENRNHIHVFAFADGKPPEEQLIAQTIKQLGSRQTAARTATGSRKTRSAPARPAVAKDNKTRSDG